MRVAVVTMETCLLIVCACADNHVALLLIKWVDQGVLIMVASERKYQLLGDTNCLETG